MTDKTTTKYLVYWDDIDGEIRGSVFYALADARGAASDLAERHPGQEFYVAAHTVTFRAETVVKEV